MGRRSIWSDVGATPEPEVSVADLPEPDPWVPQPVAVVFGSAPGWDPTRERRALKVPVACDLATRELLYELACPTCGGDRGAIQPGSRLTCGSCWRTGFDERLAKILEDFPPPKPDRIPPRTNQTRRESRAAARITG